MTAEQIRLVEAREQKAPWKKWGPYLSERQWGTVREDYSEGGDAWNYFSHDQARSRAYRWGEDGLAGISDDQQRLCFALALWNGKDAILKERLFGLTNSESNHGEDVKEYYFYLDSTPTHSYMKYLYKYPQAAFPYAQLVETSRGRGRHEFEYELLDTGVFDQDRYFDVFVEYAKQSPEDILIQITIHNRGPEPADLDVLPTLWFRNQWSWHANPDSSVLCQSDNVSGRSIVKVYEAKLGHRYLYCEGDVPLLFTENETNTQRIFGVPNRTPYVKDSIHDYVVHGQAEAVNPEKKGTKAAAHYRLTIRPGECQVVRLRLSDLEPSALARTNGEGSSPFGRHFEDTMGARRKEADEFYAAITPATLTTDQANVMRQALAGMLWSKQFYHYDVDKWLEERGSDPFKPTRKAAPRNDQWHHMYNGDVISMPDKWEYPWYAAWDLAFHVIALTMVDVDFGKQQLQLMLRERYLHPNGQIPAYEWNFGDVNPPVHAWSTIFTYRLDKAQKGEGDTLWLKSCFQKLLLNFTWWVNRKDRTGRNVFEGGFLGLDNIGVFDRSSPLPTGGYLEQADGTAWMALYADNMLEIAIELAMTDDDYMDMVLKFLEHDTWITSSLVQIGGGTGMWDEEDGFFYDVLRLPDGQAQRLKVRSMVGLLPLCAATSFDGKLLAKYPEVEERFQWFMEARPELAVCSHDPRKVGSAGRHLFAVLDEAKLRRVLARMLDENEFLSPYGIRSLSRYHADHPYVLHAGGQEYRVEYLPAESDSGMFGGNSNWRGPIWMPVNALIVRALLHYYAYYGDSFTVECPTGSGTQMNLYQVAEEISRRLGNMFLKDADGRRPVYGGTRKFQDDPHWRDCLLFYEYFHGDNGAGLGANHQTGWTGIIARLMQIFAAVKPELVLHGDKTSYAEILCAFSDWSVGGLCRRPNAVSGSHWRTIAMTQARYPALYQINTRVWLTELSRDLHRVATLDDIPNAALDRVAQMGFDWVWLLSVWQTGLAGQRVSRSNPQWRKEFQETLPDLCEDDIAGSGFAITGYTVHGSLGGDAALARLRKRLHKRGLRLLLDFVPNHTGLDHPWVENHPEYYIPGTELDLARAPQNYTWAKRKRGDLLLAHGRDPYFPGWPDTLQLNYGNPATQEAMIGELLKIAGQCDGVRCDMAMLVLPDVFERTWGIPSQPFWPTATQRVRARVPEFCFMAEVYWDLEWTLQQQGFDYTYDKRLYDRLRDGYARPAREHLCAELDYQSKMARFLENHDEPRAAATFSPDAHEAAAVVTFLTPGLRFFHQGQFEGRKKRISPHLCRGPQEPIDPRLQAFYDRLLAVLRQPVVRSGQWELLYCEPAWADNWTWDCFLAFDWHGPGDERLLVAVNYAPNQSQCYVRLPIADLAGRQWRFQDQMGTAVYDRDGDDLQSRGLYLDMQPWQYSIFSVTRIS